MSVSLGHKATQPDSLCRLTDTAFFVYFVYTSKVIRYLKLTKGKCDKTVSQVSRLLIRT